jgi:ketosteroid isomerase-like protein
MATRYVLEAGDTAVLSGQWKLTGRGPDGTAMEMTGRSVEVLRRQADGTWLFVLDHPFGAD